MRKIIITALAVAALSGCAGGPFTPQTGPIQHDDTGPSTGPRDTSDRKTNVRDFSAAGMNLRSYDKGGLSYIEHRGIDAKDRGTLTANGGR